MASYIKEDGDRWFDYNYFPSKRIIYLGSHTAETKESNGESGTDCQMAEFCLKALIHLNLNSKKPIIIHMNNMGGDYYHAMAIYDAIRASRCHVYGICWGYAMSMGSIIIQACDTRIVAPHCTFMIHDGSEYLSGTPKTVEAWTTHYKKLRKHMYEIYLSRMKAVRPRMNIKRIEELCSHDTIMSAQEAVRIGLADWILDTLKDPYEYCVTSTQDGKWQPGMKSGKHETEDYLDGDV